MKNKPEYLEPDLLLKGNAGYGTSKRKNVRRSRRADGSERHDRKSLIRVSFVFWVLSLAVILTAVFLFFRDGGASQARSGDMGFAFGYMEGSASEISDGITVSLSAEDAVELVRSALQNRDPALVESFFILGASATTQQRAVELLEQLGTVDGDPVGFESLGEKLTEGGAAEEVLVFFETDGLPSNRLAQILFEDGGWRIDLDSYARHASPSWEDILGRECDVAVVRLFVTADSYYNGGRYLEDHWKCYALASPDVEEVFYGYAARGSAQEKAMDRILSNETEFHRATLEILDTRAPVLKQFEISRVFSDDWFIGETHLDEGF